MSDLDGRGAVVTGGARGIGAAIARALSGRGARVAIFDVDSAGAQGVAAELGDGAVGIEVDVRSRAAIAAAYAEAEDRFGAVDILVNNAALTVARPVWDIDADEWDLVMAVNLRSVLFGAQVAGPRMRGRGWGRIVNVASLAGQHGGLVAGAHYAASKAGVLVLTKILAADLAASGVTVNAVVPAAIRGPAMEAMDGERISALRSRVPVGRFGEPEEVAELVAFVCSPKAGYVTGAALDINGGLGMR